MLEEKCFQIEGNIFEQIGEDNDGKSVVNYNQIYL